MRIRLLSILLMLAVAAPFARAEEEPPARRPRPPPDYSGRIQLHELPATVAPPKLPEVKEDERRIETRAATRLFSDRPAPAILMTPSAPADAPLPGLREMIQESVRRPDARSGSTGWGWLADEIATNRARRAERESRQAARNEQEDELEREADGIERQDQRLLDDALQADRRQREAEFAESAKAADAVLDSALLSMARPDDESILDAAIRGRGDPRAADGAAPLERLLDRSPADWSAGFDSRFWGFDQRVESDREKTDRKLADRVAEARPEFEGRRLLNREELWPVGRPSGDGARTGLEPAVGSLNPSPLWSAPAFTPIAVGPVDVSATPLPATSGGIGALQASPATTPTMDSIGGERERAAPRTLPW